jgi:uncharacterized protein (TIGR03435 family)
MPYAIGIWSSHRLFLLFAAILLVEPLSAQGTTPAKEFEVLSIRDAPELSPDDYMSTHNARKSQISPGSVRIPYESMERILQRAFGLARPQVVAPAWTQSRHFSIAAKLPAGATQDDVPEMLRSMLMGRFHMAYHTEVRDTPVLMLTLGKGGVKAEKVAAAQSRPRQHPIAHGGGHYELATTSSGLADFLKRVTFSPVVDRTGLVDSYLFSIDLYPFGKLDEDGKSSDPPTGDFFAYLARRYDEALAPLGLRLTSSKSAIENVIIDQLDREPTEN